MLGVLAIAGASVVIGYKIPDTIFISLGILSIAYTGLDMVVMHLTVKIKFDGNRSTKAAMEKELHRRFERLNVMQSTNRFVRYEQIPRHLGFIVSVNCLFEGGDAYLNIMSLGKAAGFMPFAGIINYFRSKRIAKSLCN
nr:hypothetical protein [uncultured Mucilaginibacter sp.]